MQSMLKLHNLLTQINHETTGIQKIFNYKRKPICHVTNCVHAVLINAFQSLILTMFDLFTCMLNMLLHWVAIYLK